MEISFKETDDVSGDATLEVWGERSRLHFMIEDESGRSMTVYIRNGADLAKLILASSWGFTKEER